MQDAHPIEPSENMIRKNKPRPRSVRVAVVGPFPPPYGGMGIQAAKLVSKLRGEGIDAVAIKTNRDLPEVLSRIKGVRTVVRFVMFCSSLLRQLREFDVVHMLSASYLSFWSGTVPTICVSKIFGKRLILNQRAGSTGRFLSSWIFLARPFLALADRIVVPSEFLRTAFSKHDIDATVLPNIADLELFKFRERNTFRPRLLITRHLSPLYNVDCTIRAFEIVKSRYPDAQLGVVGSGRTESQTRQLVEDLKLADVVFYGYVPHDDLPPIYDRYDICVNSSNVDNYPGSLIEAFACGLPVVSTRAGGIPFMVDEGRTGLLVDLDDHRALAEKVIYLIQNPEHASRMAGEARKIAEKNRWGNVFEELKALYEL